MKRILFALALPLALVPSNALGSTSTIKCPHLEGQWIATEHYAANLLGEIAEKISLFNGPGGSESRNYGLGQDPVIVIAEACVDGVMWRQVKFPAERYGIETIRWVQASVLRLH